jgi:hypothetical protein
VSSAVRCAVRWTALACFVVALGCTSNEASKADLSGGADVEDRDAGELNSADDGSGRAQPDATDLVALRPYISELLIQHDRVVNQIEADPSIVADRDSELVKEFLALYEPDSEIAEGLLDGYGQTGEAGVSTLPFDDTHPAFESRLDGEIERVSVDEVRIPTCEALRYRKVDAEGTELEQVPFMERWGEATAVRVDGKWLFRIREVFPQMVWCRTEGTN